MNINIDIKGDGNAIGNGNRVLVDKRTVIRNKIINNNNGGGGGGGRSDSGLEISVFVLAAIVTAVIVGAWKFAEHAFVIYPVLKLCVLLMGLLGMTSTIALFGEQPMAWRIDQLLILAAVAMTGFSVWISADGYPLELTQLAQQAMGAKAFWCGLSERGQQVASLHMLSISLLAAPAIVLMSIATMCAFARWIFFATGMIPFGYAAMWQRRWMGGIAVVLAGICLLSQTDIGMAYWAELHATKSMMELQKWVCPSS